MRKSYFTIFILDFKYKIEIKFFFTEGLFLSTSYIYIISNKNETMFGSGYENCPEFGVLGGVFFKLDIL
jgi:hypothetical protein